MKKIFSKLIVLSLILVPLLAGAYTSPGSPTGHVNDFAELIDAQQQQELEAKLKNYAENTGHEIAVVTIESLGDDETVETYAVKLFEEWKIGKEKEDNGLLLLVSEQ
ncbi:MAG: TPM domain-containing protein, partial [bacterium]|nr:TPM domain-containing protein [bacterium]